LSHATLIVYLDNEILNVPIHERDTVASVIPELSKTRQSFAFIASVFPLIEPILATAHVI